MNKQVIIRLPQLYDAGGDLSKKWYVQYFIRDPKANKLQRFKEYKGLGGKNPQTRYANAEKIIKELTAKLQNGWSPFTEEKVVYADSLQYQTAVRAYHTAVAKNGTYSYYATQWLEQIKPEHAPSTLADYRSKLRLFGLWLTEQGLYQCDVTTFDNKLFCQFFDFIIRKRDLSRVTVNKFNMVLHNFCHYIQTQKPGFLNPVFDMPKTKTLNENPPMPIRKEDIAKIIAILKAHDPQLLLASKFLYYCSIRPGNELHFLKIKDLDLQRGTVTVTASLAKTDITRTVGIPGQFLKELLELKLDKYPREYYIMGNKGKPGPNPYSKNAFRVHWDRLRKKHGIPEHYKFYGWKHTGNVAAADAGVPIYEIQQQNGHHSIKTTERYLRNKAGSISQNVILNWPTL